MEVCSGSVHGYVSATHYGYLFAQEYRCASHRLECLSMSDVSGQVAPQEHYAVGIFTGDSC